MKSPLAAFSVLSFAALLLIPQAYADPRPPADFYKRSQPAQAAKDPAAVCCLTNKECAGKDCCTVVRHYFPGPGGRSPVMRELRACRKTCSLGGMEQRRVCGKGKGV